MYSEECRRCYGAISLTLSSTEVFLPRALGIRVTEEELSVDLEDGRTVIVPLGWFPRLTYGTPEERANWRLTGRGEGIHWPALDEDISVENLIMGRPSRESQRSLKRWLAGRGESPGPPV